MAKKRWTAADIADQTGRVAIVTGANSGIGFETAKALADKGAKVVLACRSEEKGRAAATAIEGDVEFGRLDLSDLSSVDAFATSFLADNDRLDLLINNAGVMNPPFSRTKDGFELQIGVNHLGHFALTGKLNDALTDTEGSRVVNVSSIAHRGGAIDFDDLNFERRPYSRWKAYQQSKIANLLFTFEHQRKLEAAGSSTIAVAAHPGWTSTNLQQHTLAFRIVNPLLAQGPPKGALPTLYGAVAEDVQGGEYFGPNGLGEWRGYPKRAKVDRAARDEETAGRLWALSEELTGVQFP